MARSATGRPTDLELKILKVLWDRGPSTVREVMETLAQQRPAGYTTVLKMLQIMTGKGLVRCDRSQRAHIYRSRDTRERTVTKLAGDLLDRVFDGSASQLVLHALEHRPTTPDELAEIRRLLDEYEGRRR